MGKLAMWNGNKAVVKQGGLSNSLWNNSELKGYIKEGAVAGYIGHEDRTIRTDKILMRVQKRFYISDADLIYYFVTNSTGRHTADNFRGKSDSEIFDAIAGAMLSSAMYEDKRNRERLGE